jgi:hypothetical protein
MAIRKGRGVFHDPRPEHDAAEMELRSLLLQRRGVFGRARPHLDQGG